MDWADASYRTSTEGEKMKIMEFSSENKMRNFQNKLIFEKDVKIFQVFRDKKKFALSWIE